MKIGMLTGIWALAEKATLSQALERVAALGFHYVDLHGVFHAGPAHLSPAQRRELPAELAGLGLEARNYVLHAPKNIPASDPAELEHSFQYLCEGIDLALSWGVRQVMLNAGQWVYGMSRQDAWDRSVRFIQRVCDYAAPRGMWIAQESEPYVWFLVNDVASTERMYADVARDNFTTLIDLGHLALAREGQDDLARLVPSIIHAHFSDHEALRHTNQTIGTGITPTADYLATLRALDIDRQVRRFGYDELVIAFELGAPGDVIPDPDERVRQSLAHIRALASDLTL